MRSLPGACTQTPPPTPAVTPHSVSRHRTGAAFPLRRRTESRCPTSTYRSQPSPTRAKGSGSQKCGMPIRGPRKVAIRPRTSRKPRTLPCWACREATESHVMSARGLSVPFLRASSKLFRREAPGRTRVAPARHTHDDTQSTRTITANGTSSAQLSLARTGSREVGICQFFLRK